MFVVRCPVHRVVKSGKSKKAQEVLDKLNSFLDEQAPELVEWLCQLFQDQQKAITYAELREAWLDGYEHEIQQWQEDYAIFVDDKLKLKLNQAIRQGALNTVASLHDEGFFIVDSSQVALESWIREHAAKLVTNIGEEARKAILLVMNYGQGVGLTADKMSYLIRPIIGLTVSQTQSNLKYRQHVYDTLRSTNPNMSESTAMKQATEAAMKYAAQQHRYRANLIANTELAYAYNEGAHESVRQAIEEGLMGDCVKVWSTAVDSRVCPMCQELDGVQVGFGGLFEGKGRGDSMLLPPAHPGCRCAIIYEEIGAPRKGLSPARKGDTINPDEYWGKIIGEHTMEQDLQAVNPGFMPEDYGRMQNCQRCGPTYEMRRRGYDVVAKAVPYSNDAEKINDYLSQGNHHFFMFENPQVIHCKGRGMEDIKRLMTEWGNGARAEIQFAWEGQKGRSHIIVAENAEGKIILADPQNGKRNVNYLKSAVSGLTTIFRMDTLAITDYMFDCCEGVLI